MTLSIEKTAAETAIATHFTDVSGSLPGAAQVAETRRSAIAKFEQSGLPHRRIEEWKYTDLRASLKTAFPPSIGAAAKLERATLDEALGPFAELDTIRLVFVDGRFEPELSDRAAIGEDIQFMPMSEALNDNCFADLHGRPNTAIEASPIGALNTAFMSDGAGFMLASAPAKPLQFVHVTTGTAPQAITTRNVIAVMDGVAATFIENFVALGSEAAQVNALTHVGIAAGAAVDHIKVQRDATASTHLSTWVVDLMQDATYRGFQYSSGAALAHNQVTLTFKGANASADISGVDLLRGSQHCDTTMVINHVEPGCTSRELFKLVLDDQARGIFQGKVVVQPEAQKTDGKQMAQALMLSQDCEFDSKPELEIYADDVACGHGSTCAELDSDLIFYCRSRGIDEQTARALLIESFIAEALEKVEHDELRDALQEAARTWLSKRKA
jgi:Fe-S cluster assembly protein SufD